MYDKETATRYLQEYVKPSSSIFTLTEYGRGETDWVRVFVASKRNSIHEVTYLAAKATGHRYSERHRGIPMGGGGYSKALDVYLAIRYALGHNKPGSVEGQNKWKEL